MNFGGSSPAQREGDSVDTFRETTGQRADALDRLTRLQALTASLSEAVTSDQVAAAILTQAAAVLGAGAGVVAGLSDDGREFVLLHATGYPAQVMDALRRFPADARLPLCDAVRDRQPVLLANRAERDARYPDTARVGGVQAEGAAAALPLVVRGQVIGGMGLRFSAERAFTEQDRTFLLTVAGLCAQALDRARLFDTERAARERAERVEAAFRESEGRFARFMQHLPGLAWAKDLEGRYVYANDAALKAFGISREELYGKTDDAIFPPATAAQFRENDQRARAAGAGVQVVETLEQPDGVLHHSLVSKFPIPGPDGATLVGGMAIDITDRKRAEEELRRRVEELETLMDVMPVAVWLARDPECRHVLGNRAGYAMLRMAEGTNLSKTAPAGDGPTHFRVHRDGREVSPEQLPLQFAASHGVEVRGVEEDLVFADGTVSHVYGSASPLFDERGKVRGAVAVFLDASALRRAEASLRESEERLRAIIDNSPAVIFVKDSQGRYVLANRACEAYAGEPAERIVGKTDHDYLPREVADRFRTDDRRVLETGQVLRYEEVAPVQGELRTSLTVKFPLRDAAGRPYAVCGIATDITDRKRSEEALREADRRKDEFLAMLAHELRNPLAPIRNAALVIALLGHADEKLRRSSEVIERQVRHLSRLVDDLLDVSRLTRGRITLRKEPLELGPVVAGAVETVRPLLDARKHELAERLPSEPVWVEGDATRLAQVVSNLLANAAKYTPDGGHIDLTVHPEGKEAVLRVRDGGIGIPADLLPRVFDLFTQGDRSLARSEGGLGIGLTLARSLMEMHGGRIEAHSDGPGKGSEFVVRLPLLEARSALAASDAGPAEHRPAAARRVLLVEDNMDAAESLALLLRLEGHEVRVAHDGPAALAAARDYRPDIIFLDIGLPHMDGYEVARRLRQEEGDQHAVLVALTGYGQGEDRRRVEAAGFDAHLVKPADVNALRRLLAELRGSPAKGG
jgi:PAS domain S-box-containing protein